MWNASSWMMAHGLNAISLLGEYYGEGLAFDKLLVNIFMEALLKSDETWRKYLNYVFLYSWPDNQIQNEYLL